MSKKVRGKLLLLRPNIAIFCTRRLKIQCEIKYFGCDFQGVGKGSFDYSIFEVAKGVKILNIIGP